MILLDPSQDEGYRDVPWREAWPIYVESALVLAVAVLAVLCIAAVQP